MVTFRVDDVEPAADRLPTRALADLCEDALVVGGDPASRVLIPDGVHPLLGAVGRAFADHRPLTLSPDAVWLTTAQGLAQHIRLHKNELRPRLAGDDDADRKRLSIDVIDYPGDAGAWCQVVEAYDKLLAAQVTDTDLFACDFSTSTDVDRVAGRIVMLDAYSPYFALSMRFICGIPAITLTGTVDDWRKIRARVDRIAGWGLESWCRSLVAILDQFVAAADGRVDTAFWRHIYSPADAYGEEVVTGWAARLYPYLERQGVVDQPNPLLDLPIDQPRDLTGDDRMGYHGPGVRSSQAPARLSRVVVTVNDRVRRDNRVVALHAGLVATTQDPDGTLHPIAGWHLTPATVEIDDVIDRIVRDHQWTPPVEATMLTAPAELVAVYHRIGSATLFGGAWRLLPAAEQGWAWRDEPGHPPIVTVIQLDDAEYIGMVTDRQETTHWVRCRVEPHTGRTPTGGPRFRLADPPANVPVLGTSLAVLLDAALDSGGDIAHLETGRLDQLE